MDLSGGVLNQLCINFLQEVKELDKYARGSYLCSTNKIKNGQKVVYERMQKVCPYKLIKDGGIDGVVFYYTKYLIFLLNFLNLIRLPLRKET